MTHGSTWGERIDVDGPVTWCSKGDQPPPRATLARPKLGARIGDRWASSLCGVWELCAGGWKPVADPGRGSGEPR